jgi:hypothetical protein
MVLIAPPILTLSFTSILFIFFFSIKLPKQQCETASPPFGLLRSLRGASRCSQQMIETQLDGYIRSQTNFFNN